MLETGNAPRRHKREHRDGGSGSSWRVEKKLGKKESREKRRTRIEKTTSERSVIPEGEKIQSKIVKPRENVVQTRKDAKIVKRGEVVREGFCSRSYTRLKKGSTGEPQTK